MVKKKSTILVSDVENGRDYPCVSAGVYGKSLYFPPNFVVKPKLPQKIKTSKK